MSILNDGAKTLVPVAAPLIGLGSAAVKLGAMTCTGPLGGLTCAVLMRSVRYPRYILAVSV